MAFLLLHNYMDFISDLMKNKLNKLKIRIKTNYSNRKWTIWALIIIAIIRLLWNYF